MDIKTRHINSYYDIRSKRLRGVAEELYSKRAEKDQLLPSVYQVIPKDSEPFDIIYDHEAEMICTYYNDCVYLVDVYDQMCFLDAVMKVVNKLSIGR